jgi:hypothetical protein
MTVFDRTTSMMKTRKEKSDERFPIDEGKTSLSDSEEQIIKRAVLSLNGNILGIVLGIISALGIFCATNWLVAKGGAVVGPHLSLLGQFFIGYSVTFSGSLIGVLYCFIIGYLSGRLIGWIYNSIIFIRKSKYN